MGKYTAPANKDPQADITSVVAGAGLTGGGTSGAATVNVVGGTGIDVTADAVAVDVSDFMTNGANNRLVTATGADAQNAEANLIFDGTHLGVNTTNPIAEVHIVTTGNADNLIVSNVLDDVNGILIEGTATNDGQSAPLVVFFRNGSDNASKGDMMGNVLYMGDNDAGQHTLYGQWKTWIVDPADGAECYAMSIQGLVAGQNKAFVNFLGAIDDGGVSNDYGGLRGAEAVFNQNSADIDFRIESDGNQEMFFVDAGSNRIGIGTSLPVNTLDLRHTAADGNNGIMIVRTDASTSDGDLLGGIGFDSTDPNDAGIPSSILESSAFIASLATEAHSADDKGGNLKFGVSLIDEDDNTVSTIVANVGPPDTTANAAVHPGLNSRATTAIVAAATYAPTIGDSGTLVIFNHANSNLTLPSINNTTTVGVQFTVFNQTGSAINAQIATSNSATINGAAASGADDIASMTAATFVATGNNTWIRIG